MTDKLKCPFCGEELAPHIDEWKSIRKLFICNNTGCFCWGQPMLLEIWQVLIDGKKAQDSLKEISRLNQYIRKELAHQIPEEASKADNSIYTITFEIAKECRKGLRAACHNYQRAKKALEGK